jgi:hypothetical protein
LDYYSQANAVAAAPGAVVGRCLAGCSGDYRCFLHRLDPPPLVGTVGQHAFASPESQSVLVGATVTGVARASTFCDLDQPEGSKFTERGGNGVAVHPVFLELFESDRQLAVVCVAVMRVFDSMRLRARCAETLRTRYAGDSSISIKRGANAPLIELRRLRLVLRGPLVIARPFRRGRRRA